MIDLPIATVIEQEGIELIESGDKYMSVCPFHDDKNPSLMVKKTSPGRFYCFGCHAQGDAIDFIRQLKGFTFKQAVNYLEVEHILTGTLKRGERMIDMIAREEDLGVDVEKKYSKVLCDTLLAKEFWHAQNKEV